MRALCHVFSGFDSLQITADDEGVVWIRGRHIAVSLDLDAADREKLRAALAEPAELPTELNVDVPPPIAPRDKAAEAREVNVRG